MYSLGNHPLIRGCNIRRERNIESSINQDSHNEIKIDKSREDNINLDSKQERELRVRRGVANTNPYSHRGVYRWSGGRMT